MRWLPARTPESTSAGIDVGGDRIRTVVVDHAGDEPEVVGVRLHDGFEGDEARGSALAETLKSLPGKPRLVAAVGGRGVTVARVVLTGGSRGRPEEIVRWEADSWVESELGETPEDYAFAVDLDDRDLVADPGRASAPVLAVAARRDLVASRMRMFQRAGRPPEVMDTEATALHNALMFAAPSAVRGTCLLLDLGSTRSVANVVAEGELVFSGSFRLTSGAALDDPEESAGMAADQLDTLTARSSGSDALEPGRIFVTGGVSRDVTFISALSESLLVECEALNPFRRARFAPELTCDFDLDSQAPQFGIALGLALRGV